MIETDTFEQVCGRYFSYDLSTFIPYFEKAILKEEPGRYLRIPVHYGSPIVILMWWSPGSATAIHDHGGIRGQVKVLKGKVREERYIFQEGELITVSCQDLTPGEITGVGPDTIHCVSNPYDSPAITLNIYDTGSESLDGTRLFDPVAQRIGILNGAASRASWNESLESFSRIESFSMERI
jgi:predicted metal-dependent enzyme (double-stranded beta helix superfamily)